MEDSSMKMILKHILNMSVLLLTGIVFAGCSSSDAPIEQPINPNPTGKYTMTVNASKGSDATTRALTIGGSSGKKLIAYWDGTEKVTVKEGATTLGTLTTITPDATDNTKAKLSGTLDKAPSGTSLTLELCSPTYGSQDGTLAYIASNCDYATATTTVTYDNDNKTITGNASFINQQAIVKFTLKDIYGFPIKANRFTISSGNDKIVQKIDQKIDQDNFTYGPLKLTIDPASETGELYTAIRHNLGTSETDDITLTAVEINHDSCVYQKSGVKFESGGYYKVNVAMKSAMLSEPLTLEAKQDDTKISFVNYSGGSIEYRINEGLWTSTTSNVSITLENAKDKISFRGNNSSYYPDDYASSIACTAPCYVYGNIMSLVDATNFATTTSLTAEHTFHSLFQGNTNIINHPSKDLLLPATTLKNYCYHAMFFGCTGLTRAPVLPAPSLVSYCYHAMFSGCSNLAYIKCLATSISATSCTTDWVYNVKKEGTFVKAPGMTNWTTGKDGIPWSVSP